MFKNVKKSIFSVTKKLDPDPYPHLFDTGAALGKMGIKSAQQPIGV
jgi:hypothetical protein